MKILIISIFSDNFGDSLIRICFTQLLKIVLKNLGADETSCHLQHMSLKEPDEALIRDSDLIFFAGGAIIGFNYLGLFPFIRQILEIAEEKEIPVVFSSAGLNNTETEGEEENVKALSDFFRMPCIRALSVRDHAALFAQYTEGCSYMPKPVCDPAVWARFVFHAEVDPVLEAKKERSEKRVGINVVRGGLFKANNLEWNTQLEQAYLEQLARLLDDAGIPYTFYTNGGYLDDRILTQLCGADGALQKNGLSFPDPPGIYNSRDLVKAIAGFDATASIRMHSSILSYALGVPSANIVWNEKIPDFYAASGHPDRLIALTEPLAETMFEKLKMLLSAEAEEPDAAYLMTLYHFLYDTLSVLLDSSGASARWEFPEVVQELMRRTVSPAEDVLDYQIKIQNEAHGFLKQTHKIERQKKKIARLQAETEALTEKLAKQKEKTAAEKEKKKAAKEKEAAAKEKAKAAKEKAAQYKEKADRYKAELDRIYNKFPVRVYRKLKGSIK